MNFIQIIKDSLKTDSLISNMRTNATIVIFTLLIAYCAQVVAAIVQAFISKSVAFNVVDLPVVIAGTIVGVLGVKGAQAVFGEKDKPQAGELK